MDIQKTKLFPSDWFYQKLLALPEGTSKATFNGRLYIVCKSTFNGGNSFKFFAEEAGGKDRISLNVYRTHERIHTKPCEQPLLKSQAFLQNANFGSYDLTPETLPGSLEETPRRLGYELGCKFIRS